MLEIRNFVNLWSLLNLRSLLLVAAPATIHGAASAQDVTGPASDWTVSSEPAIAYGWIDGEPDSDFSSVAGVVYGADGSIAVADRILATITVLSADGQVLATMGRQGDGPGEFSDLANLVGAGEGRLVAFDRDHQRLSEWTFDGTLVRDTRLSRAGESRPIGEIGRFADGGWVARDRERVVAAGPSGVGRDTVAYHRLEEGGAVGEVLVRVPGPVTSEFDVGGMGAIRHALFSPRVLGGVQGNCLLVAASDDPVLRILDRTGGLRGEVRLDIPTERVTAAHRQRWISAMAAVAEETMGRDISPRALETLERMGEAVGMAERMPFAHDLLVDDLGYIWVQPYQLPDGPGSSEWRVFAETGQALGSVRLPESFRALRISSDAITGVWTDELGRQYVRVHALDRRGEIESRPLPLGCR